MEGHFARFENTIQKTNASNLTATRIMPAAWKKGSAKGLAQKDSIFNGDLEKKWVEQRLFYANSTRYAPAMGGGLRVICQRSLVYVQKYSADD